MLFTVERVLLENLRFRKHKFQRRSAVKRFSLKQKCTGDKLNIKFSLSFNAISKNCNKKRPCAGKDANRMKRVLPDKKL